MLLCIICNEISENTWPKKWACWKENGKFSECICKLLGLPKYPYEDDFQSSDYCSRCQKRVYGIFQMMWKWEKLQGDIAKLREKLEKDFRRNLKGEECNGSGERNSKADDPDRTFSATVLPTQKQICTDFRNNSIRRRILERLSGPVEHNIDYCRKGNESRKDKDVAQQYSADDNSAGSSRSHSLSDEQSEQIEQCKPCISAGEHNMKKCCTSEYCADCTICNHSEVHSSKSSTADASKPEAIITPQSKNDTGSSRTRSDMEREFGEYVSAVEKPLLDELAYYAQRVRCYRSNCTRTFASKEELDIHVKRHHEGVKCPYICDECGKSYQWRRELDAHRLKHSGGVAVSCHLCGRGFRTKRLLNVHLKTKHARERKFKCSLCEKSFISQSKLKTHFTIHSKVFPFLCTVCNKGFSAKTFLNFHMVKHMESSPYQCKTCAKTFSTPRNLQVHQFTHTLSHPFNCSVCDAGMSSEALLKKHMLKHSGEKRNACEICGKKFRFPSSLKKHLKAHGGVKQFQCTNCSKAFIDKYKLTRHLRTHSGEKPFQCHICLKNFSTKDYLSTHVKHHEKSKSMVSESTEHNTCIDSFQSSFHNPVMPHTLHASRHENYESTFSATIELGNFSEPLHLNNVYEDNSGALMQFNDQGEFASSMSFQATDNLELRYGELCTLSFQQL